ncbi:alpha/beta fold hydrolase [Streptomyces fildesensis]|uniref:Alpha/beta fold hydrolase n=1 Tax=Streptomyces fildesensis TaxID=375757 RepID=A0ABW8CGD2_9ACTN
MSSDIFRPTVTASLPAGVATLGTSRLAEAGPQPTAAGTDPQQHHPRPTTVLIHGAFADASSWQGVVELLQAQGHQILAPALPLRGLASDAAYIRSVLQSITGPIVLVGHSYGGSVITQAAGGLSHVKALVYIAAFVPDIGESALALTGKFPGSTLPQATSTQTYPLPGGEQGEELVIKQDRFHDQFAAGVPAQTARVMAAGQRPITLSALQEPAQEAAWKTIPSWYLVATEDRNIPPAAEQWMAQRAGAHTVSIRAPHAAAVTDPGAVTDLIRRAIRSTTEWHAPL